MRYRFIPIFSLATALSSCDRPNAQTASSTPLPVPEKSAATVAPAKPAEVTSTELSPGAIDACTLLSREEAESVIGEPIVDTRPGGKSDGGIDISQCYIAATTSANSVSLVVYQKAAKPGARDPKELWERSFSREADDEEGEKEGRERKPPEKIEGLGDEAFWIGNPIGSALYVLKANTYVRISLGGAADTATKLEKAKTIARLVLPRI